MGTTIKSEFLEKREGLTEPETVLRTVKDVDSIVQVPGEQPEVPNSRENVQRICEDAHQYIYRANVYSRLEKVSSQ